MSTDDSDERSGDSADTPSVSTEVAEGLDDNLIDLLAWVLDTETRARIYIYLRENPGSTSEEVAEGTGLYPSTVREALAALNEEGKVTRSKRESSGAGNNPYEYLAIPPSDLTVGILEQVEEELNTVFNLDDRLANRMSEHEPIRISVEGGSEHATADDD